MFWFNNILFSNEVSPKFEQLGARKDKSVLDSGLAGNNENFWQEIAEKYQEKNDDYDLLAYNNAFFDGIDPSVKLEHNWSKLQEIYEGLTKSYGEVFENDNFINFCGARSEMYYLHLWLEEKPQLQNMVVIDLPEGVFFDSGNKDQFELRRQPSPTASEPSFSHSVGKSNLAASINAPVKECRKSRESGQVDLRISQQKLEMQVSHNYDDNVKQLIEVKRQLETEMDPGRIKVLKKYEKKLTKVVDFSSSTL
jgi:hypothetical protein